MECYDYWGWSDDDSDSDSDGTCDDWLARKAHGEHSRYVAHKFSPTRVTCKSVHYKRYKRGKRVVSRTHRKRSAVAWGGETDGGCKGDRQKLHWGETRTCMMPGQATGRMTRRLGFHSPDWATKAMARSWLKTMDRPFDSRDILFRSAKR